MKIFKATILAVAALGMATTAMAEPFKFVVTGSNPHNAPGHFTATGFGNDYDCAITTFNFDYSATGSGATLATRLSSLTGSVLVNDHGTTLYEPCDDSSGTFDTFVVKPTALNAVSVATINFNAPLGLCTRSNAPLVWTNGTTDSTVTATNLAVGFCTLQTLNLTAQRVKIATNP